ncbi:hypothetical protein IRT45_27605 [Nocardia sp. BSTN01]|uniref:hypothetical protein n=1 Tax=Nocardia sp. BSTN01 TaxID=2783665 RepID=UPI00188FE643|nr:hypothetical protein [Nocardia sp. BSTN01]MBF5000910.1 hypothetical protein [Nocardia sp. BSTN01]
MKIVIFASHQPELVETEESLGHLKHVEIRIGIMPELTRDCDALILPGVFAHDRYGFRAIPKQAQVLVNNLGDTAPRLVVATPSYAPHFRGSHPEPGKSAISEMLSKRFVAIKRSREHAIDTVAIPLDSMSFEGIDKKVVASSFCHALSYSRLTDLMDCNDDHVA